MVSTEKIRDAGLSLPRDFLKKEELKDGREKDEEKEQEEVIEVKGNEKEVVVVDEK